MESNFEKTGIKKNEKFTESITFKAMIVGILILIMFLPNNMVQELIYERQGRSREAVYEISEKWSLAQQITGPVLSIPYTTKTIGTQDQVIKSEHILYVTPKELNVNAELVPEERHYGIYKAILYQSTLKITGSFASLQNLSIPDSEIHWDKVSILLGISDLRGVTNNVKMSLQGNTYNVKAGRWVKDNGNALIFDIPNAAFWNDESSIPYSCELALNGSEKIEFIPIGQNTHVSISGNWPAPSFIGKFTPAYQLSDNGFHASWSVLDINRAIPVSWTEKNIPDFYDSAFGVRLVEMVDHYQQNMRSAKYSMLFIALTFLVFFFVELLTKTKIHPVQYFLVGIALMIFYTLLLAISEQLGFGIAYLIASSSTIILITVYCYSIFKGIKPTAILFSLLVALYLFLYMTLQMEDTALLIGSIGLFL
ncbi:cell envelope integrity protein CreD, partial [Bacteroidales bacterium OttesenSCG-928-C03]|nr:cell envelope integrity protein CreD [Bacteroidales bacterium OttesenSCG-928-E04]MDL2309339.1 cell envelope integrity protein CreD [Bacteroidales bacterium OttesenSCG-928-C03]